MDQNARRHENSDETITRLLDSTSVWAVVGLSDNRSRTAYRIADYLRAHGKRVVPVHPSAPTVA
nr:CoA-binding protein [Micromonospora sp. DSM 115978]